jgi:hypothetical protein
VLELDGDTLLILAGAADIVLRDYLQMSPEAVDDGIKRLHAAPQRGVVTWERRRQLLEQREPVGR